MAGGPDGISSAILSIVNFFSRLILSNICSFFLSFLFFAVEVQRQEQT